MYRIYSSYVLFTAIVIILGLTGCKDPEGIEIIPPADAVEFKIVGQIGGQAFAMDKDVVLVTSSDNTATGKTYAGQLFSNCESDIASTCERSLTITFLDSIHGSFNNDGFPVMLEPGLKDVYTGIDMSTTDPYLEIHAIDGSALRINDNLQDPSEPYQHVPSSSFPEFDHLTIETSNGPVGFGSYHDIRVSLNGNEMEYYYFKYKCAEAGDSIPIISIEIQGNSSFVLDDFTFFSMYGEPLNPENIFDSFIDPILFEFVAVHRTYGDTTYSFNPVIVIPPIFDSLFCYVPFSAVPVEGITTSEASGIVLIEYRNETGSLYTSLDTDASTGSFLINSTELYQLDDSGNQTVKSSISFDGLLKNPFSDDFLEFKNIEMTFGFGFLPE